MVPTHSTKPSGTEQDSQTPEGQPCIAQPMEEDEEEEEEPETVAPEASATMHIPPPPRNQDEVSTKPAAAQLLPDETKGEIKKGQVHENSQE